MDVLLVDDSHLVLTATKLLIQQTEKVNNIATANNGEEALKLLEENEFDIVITDLCMPKMQGNKLAEIITLTHKKKPIIIVCSSRNPNTEEELDIERFSQGFVPKPITAEKIKDIFNS